MDADSRQRKLMAHLTNPATRLEAVFATIARERMAALPIVNPALAVAVPAMRDRDGEWLGVLLTPWAISLVILPGTGGRFRVLGADETQTWHFKSGDYAFMGNAEPELGPYQTCSLFSPVFEFADQAAAEATALAAFAAVDAVDATAPQAPSRRAFLRGGFLARQP
jgi:[NiFe] hydrogenase assembly HybE family chaperone